MVLTNRIKVTSATILPQPDTTRAKQRLTFHIASVHRAIDSRLAFEGRLLMSKRTCFESDLSEWQDTAEYIDLDNVSNVRNDEDSWL